ncbi:MAG: CHC2 zinc finger domain-containing protein [Hominisplanchenecus sp.]
MNFFESVKQAVTTKQAAERYGLEVDKHGMALCPFHEDHHPSLMLDQRYYCFGCHATGDAIDFTARLFGISQKSAALKLAQDFGINSRPPTQSDIPDFHAELHPNPEQLCIRVLREYLRLLRIWKVRYRPAVPGDPLDDRFVESCQTEASITDLMDALMDVDAAIRNQAVEVLLQDGRIHDLQAYVARKKKEEMQFDRASEPCA